MKLPSVRLALIKVFLVLISVSVALLITELGLRWFSPRYYPIIPDAYEYDAETAFRLRSNSHLTKVTDHQQETITNSLGTSNFQENFDGYETLVFAVGDSYTQGTGLPADSSYPSQLDLLLNRDEQGFYTKKFGVVNLGVAGYGGEQSLINLRRWSKRLKPPAIILYLGCDNDFEDDLLFKAGVRHSIAIAGSPSWGIFTAPSRLFLEETHLGILTRQRVWEREKIRIVGEARPNYNKKSSTAELELPIIEQLRAFADENGTLLIVSWSDAGESYRWMQQWSDREGVAFADWFPKAESVRKAMPKLSLDNPHSGAHHRGWLNQIIAAEFARQVRAHGK